MILAFFAKTLQGKHIVSNYLFCKIKSYSVLIQLKHGCRNKTYHSEMLHPFLATDQPGFYLSRLWKRLNYLATAAV